jgi:oligopeptidase B
LLSCLQLLFSLQVTSPGLVAGHAVSAGAVTLAAAVNAQPSWFAAVVLECPFVELCSPVPHALDEHEQDEWGDPKADAAVAEVIAGLCPYNNLPCLDDGSGSFPAVLVTAGLQDVRVPFWMPLKYVARLRSMQAAAAQQSNNNKPVLLQFDKNSGHFDMGVSGGSMQDIALQHAFFCSSLQHK